MLNGLRVLIVDDDVDSCDLLTLILRSYEAESQAAFSASQALEAFIQFQPNVLVSDIAMPGEDGYSLLHKVRNLEADGQAIPAIAITAIATEDAQSCALSSGFHKWLPKPLDIDELIAAIVALTGRRQQVERSCQEL